MKSAIESLLRLLILSAITDRIMFLLTRLSNYLATMASFFVYPRSCPLCRQQMRPTTNEITVRSSDSLRFGANPAKRLFNDGVQFNLNIILYTLCGATTTTILPNGNRPTRFPSYRPGAADSASRPTPQERRTSVITARWLRRSPPTTK